MIRLKIVEGDLLDARADAILLTIDGALPASAGVEQVRRSLGRIARAFARRFPECELVDEIDSQVSFPLAAGRAAAVELPEGAPFRFAIVLSMLPHAADQTSDDVVRAAAGGAFAHALALCDELGVAHVAAPLLKGGWRITSATAAALMLNAIANGKPRHALTVEIRVLDEPDAAARLRELAPSYGIDTIN